MKKFSLFILVLLIVGISLTLGASVSSAAQPAKGLGMDMSIAHEGMLPDVHDEDGIKDDKFKDEKDEEADAAFQFDGMVGNEVSDGPIADVASAGKPWTLEDGSASLDDDSSLKVEVEGLMFSDGTSAAGTMLGAGVACMNNSVFYKAVADEDSEEFTLDEEGNASFDGHVDFGGNPCVGPVVLVTTEAGDAWFAASGLSMMMDDDIDDIDDDDVKVDQEEEEQREEKKD
jgi:hypothetical protein